MAGVIILLIGAVLATYFLLPACPHAASVAAGLEGESLLEAIREQPNDEPDRLPKNLLPVHYR